MGGKLKRAALACGLVLGVGAALPSAALVITKSNTVEGIVDGSSDSRLISITAADLGSALNNVLDVNVTIEFMKCSDLDAPLGTPLPATCPDDVNPGFAYEIKFLLTNPTSTQRTLVDYYTYGDETSTAPGARVAVTFDDAAGSAVGGDPVSGSFQPVDVLSAFNGAGAVGDWELSFEDQSGFDPLGFASFTLEITVQDPSTQPPGVPAPATALLVGLGLAGLAARRRKK